MLRHSGSTTRTASASCSGASAGGRLDNFLVRVKDSYLLELHLDTDEGNAIGAATGDYVTICEN